MCIQDTITLIMLFFAYEASCPDDQIKLIGGSTEQSGRVVICYDERWKTLDYYRWSSSVAKVTTSCKTAHFLSLKTLELLQVFKIVLINL